MLTHEMRTHFPNLTIIGRARNVTDLFELRTRDVDLTERETVESALLIDPKALEQMGADCATAKKAERKFRKHNLATPDAVFLASGMNRKELQSHRKRVTGWQNRLSRTGPVIAMSEARLA